MKKRVFICLVFIIAICSASAISVDYSISGSASLSGYATTQQLAMSIGISGAPTLILIQPYDETYLRNYSIPLSFLQEGADNYWYNINNGNNASISNNSTFSSPSGSNTIFVYANNSFGATRKSRHFTVDLTKLPIYYEEYSGALKGSSTDFLAYTYERIGNITAILENTDSGKIEFYNRINMTSMASADFDTNTNISAARIYFNTGNLQAFLDSSARISFYNISIDNPLLVLNKVPCPLSLCTGISYSGGIFSFNFTGFNQSILLEVVPRVYFTEPTPYSGKYLNVTYLETNATSLISNLKNITIKLYDSSSFIDSAAGTSSFLYAKFLDLKNGIYFFNATACNTSNYCSHTETRNITINVSARWFELTPPQGVFEPENASLLGTHLHTFFIKFRGLKLNPTERLDCFVRKSNGAIMNLNATGINVDYENYSLNYTITSSDPITNDASAGYVPWELKNCSIFSSGNYTSSEEIMSRIYVHSPSYWQDNEVTRAVACEGSPYVYFNNTAKCEFSEDTLFALQMRNGNPVSEYCFNAPSSCSGDYCKGILFSKCEAPDYFGGLSALTDDPNGYTTFTVSFASYSTQVAYTRYTNTSGTFKLRIVQALNDKPFSITIYNLTNVSGANVYGAETGSGATTVNDNGDGTFNVARNRLGSSFTGTLDFAFNISFNNLQNQNRTLKLVLAYGTDTNQGSPTYFTAEFNPSYGLYNLNEAQSTSRTNELNGVCGDNVNNDFDYLSGFWANSQDCYDSDCNNVLGAVQTNEFGSGKSGLCNYQAEMNCTDKYDNDYSGLTDCHDIVCFQNSSKYCPITEAICNDGINNDWDYTTSADPIGNNGTRYGVVGTLDLADCKDIDCNNSLGNGGTCNWGYETVCNDGFNNDALQLYDCRLNSVFSSTSMPSINDAEYDCSSFCRLTTSQETGSLCNDNKDNDFDAVIATGYYTGISNTSYGAGIDCRWGGYFGIGSDYNPDENCNQTILSNGKRCELARETTCNDSFDNDYDRYAGGMPPAGWSLDPSGYQSYFGQTFSEYADYDDYDCKTFGISPSSESLNDAWCFDSIDNDLDAYYFDGNTYTQNFSTGKDCLDSDCSEIANPANPLEGCFSQEYNLSNYLLNDSARCSDNLDNDFNGLTDCYDLSCFKKFDSCSSGACKSQENVSWSSCADNLDNDYSGATDCSDSNCLGMPGSLTGALCRVTEVCNDNFDNNANSIIDCSEHSACDNQAAGKVNDNNVYCRATESTNSDCFDQFDNDADGKLDCYDESCNSACNLSTISGTSPISLPVTSSLSLNSVSDAYISSYTKQTRNSEYYSLTMKMTSQSTNAQWTLGTASKPFNKTSFDTSTSTLAGANMASFTLSETQNGFIISSNHANLSLGYEVVFMIKSNKTFASSTYELTYGEEKGSKISLLNYPYYEVDENITPQVQSMQIIYGIDSTVYLRANISDNNALGSCVFTVSGPQYFYSESTNCKASFTPALEGDYNISVTPKDYYSNTGTALLKQYSVNIIPKPVSISTDMSFYHNYESAEIAALFDAVSTDTIGSCGIFARNSTSEISLGSIAASGNSCSGAVSLSGLGDGEYSLLAKATETTENNILESNKTAFFICSNSDGLCKYADFNSDSKPDFCPDITPVNITSFYPAQSSQLAVGTNQTWINITTNERSECRYSFESVFSFENATSFTNTNSLKHSFMLSVSAGTYNLYYKCNDTSGNINPSSIAHTFIVLSAAPSPGAPSAPGAGAPGIPALPAPEIPELKCLDGTAYGSCSSTAPLYCSNGNLIDKCSSCGCSGDEKCFMDESCAFVCKQDSDCKGEPGKEFECIEGKCRVKEKECMKSSDCRPGKYCDGGQCIAVVEEKPAIISPENIKIIAETAAASAAIAGGIAAAVYVALVVVGNVLLGGMAPLAILKALALKSGSAVVSLKDIIASKLLPQLSRQSAISRIASAEKSTSFIVRSHSHFYPK